MYTQPDGTSVDFNFLEAQSGYSQPGGLEVDFEFPRDGAQIQPQQPPGLILNVRSSWTPPPPTQSRLEAPFGDATETEVRAGIRFKNAPTRLQERISAPFARVHRRDAARGLDWGTGEPRETSSRIINHQAPPKDLRPAPSTWEEASVNLDRKRASPFIVRTPAKDRKAVAPYFETDLRGRIWRRVENLPAPLAKYPAGRADFDFIEVQVLERPTDFNFQFAFAPHPSQPKDAARRVPVQQGRPINDRKGVPWGPSGQRDTTLNFVYPDYDGPITDPGEVVIAFERESYLIMNSVNVKRVSDDTAIEMQDLRISLDVDSWAWALQGVVIGTASLAIVDPGPAGPVDIEVEINGYTWIFMIESYDGSRAHANQRFTVRGVSKTQLLAEPYAQTRSKQYDTTIAASQIIDDELLGTGFSVAWDTTSSWSVEGGAFSFQDLAPVALVKRIADAAGAIVVPHRSAPSLTIKPRFKISPWHLDAAILGDLDAQVPMSLVTRLALQYQPAPLYDSVYVSGTTHGHAVLATLNGAGGLAPAPNVFDDLMTDTAVNTERARQELAGSGAHGVHTLTLPIPEVLEAPGLLEPGMMIEAVEGNDTWRGYVLGVSITAPRSGAAKVEQTAQIVRFYEHG